MCNPQIALTIASVASAGIQYKMQKAQQQAQYAAQKRQNELANKNAEIENEKEKKAMTSGN